MFPGRLSVSKTFGDIEAKKVKYGGNPRVIVADPDVKGFKIMPNYDYILLACKAHSLYFRSLFRRWGVR